MTTRDDLVSRTMKAIDGAADALEAKDAEIASEKEESASYHKFWIEERDKRITAESLISDLERQLAEETERCARVADDFAVRAENKIETDPKSAKLILAAEANAAGAIAAAIRGGAK